MKHADSTVSCVFCCDFRYQTRPKVRRLFVLFASCLLSHPMVPIRYLTMHVCIFTTFASDTTA